MFFFPHQCLSINSPSKVNILLYKRHFLKQSCRNTIVLPGLYHPKINWPQLQDVQYVYTTDGCVRIVWGMMVFLSETLSRAVFYCFCETRWWMETVEKRCISETLNFCHKQATIAADLIPAQSVKPAATQHISLLRHSWKQHKILYEWLYYCCDVQMGSKINRRNLKGETLTLTSAYFSTSMHFSLDCVHLFVVPPLSCF